LSHLLRQRFRCRPFFTFVPPFFYCPCRGPVNCQGELLWSPTVPFLSLVLRDIMNCRLLPPLSPGLGFLIDQPVASAHRFFFDLFLCFRREARPMRVVLIYWKSKVRIPAGWNFHHNPQGTILRWNIFVFFFDASSSPPLLRGWFY